MDNISLQIKIICLVSILAGILSSVIPKGKMKGSFSSLSAVVILTAMIIPLKELKSTDFSSFGFEGGQVSESLEAEVSQAEDLIYESVICDTVEADFSKEGIKSEVNVECENKSGELTVINITVCGDFSQEEKAYMTDYLITCFKEAEINFKEEENG